MSFAWSPAFKRRKKLCASRAAHVATAAWLLVQVFRNLGLAARFVSGYLIQLAPDIKSLDGPGGVSTDFTDLHAWAEVYLPGAGWVGFDATSGLMAGEGHIPLACSADPVTAAAITGFFSEDDENVVTSDPEDGAEHGDGATAGQDDFGFSMKVTRIQEDPRVTKPYTDEQWAEIEALGHQVDVDLERGDVRLTMGGEPTFVSIDDMDGEEWISAAVGPNKYKPADQLIRRLRDRFATGGFLHHAQGKWYPGESLPRWGLGLYWRKDGEPIWQNPALVADEQKPNRCTDNDAHAFGTRLAERLGVETRFVVPGYEDVWYYLWKERRLPINVDPFESKIEDKEERARLARVFEQGLDKVVGYALPLKREYFTDGTGAWISGDWFLRPERMYLIPGDSPMGYRLPLDSIPWVAKSDYPHVHPLDPWADRGPLPRRQSMSSQRYVVGAREAQHPAGFVEQVLEPDEAELVGVGADGGFGERLPLRSELKTAPRRSRSHPANLAPAFGESAPWIVRTALCVEARGGALRVFMPPQRYLEDYLELVAAIEDTASDLGLPVLVEGYTPPYDPRIHQMRSDARPRRNRSQYQAGRKLGRVGEGNHRTFTKKPRLCRLGTEKFMLDGRHTGTGGGNHIVLGGPTPADSPLLRRPDLLRSLLGYWHNHPGLSYLFSGMFRRADESAPRVDEARTDQVYELDLAFKEVTANRDCPPWLVDRIFRNLLIDSTGNTHRAEFCIDKLYAPESPTGRLGLLEMRGFEMPPHSRMSLTQHLLLRALIARFWQTPYTNRLVR